MTTTLADFTFPTFTLYLSLAVLGSLALATFGSVGARRLVVDAGIGALVGGYLLARLLYAAQNPALFAPAPLRLLWDGPGGLDWQGAYVGALLGAWAVMRWYKHNPHPRPREPGKGAGAVYTLGVIALPLVALAGWMGCARVGCLYGAEVETLAYYPAWLVTESRDIYGIIAPRYDTVRFGGMLSWGLLVWAGFVWWRGQPSARTFWAMSAVWCVGMFGIGFLRADYTPPTPYLRADQWLDLLLLLGVLVMLVRSGRPGLAREQMPAPPFDP
jgi:prolipoprotein diacylglyceryltransferase